ncbi:hypothetical protein OUZ56_006648 [Daphnia magna]|uniref:Uncharacterized protein n=1 Tax=Daphnia magna TaxID=35525 RepID=A0ABQ9YW94_9CRUS|nr:hypothetical protein OUZ56_006648 [Daphnia magna]
MNVKPSVAMATAPLASPSSSSSFSRRTPFQTPTVCELLGSAAERVYRCTPAVLQQQSHRRGKKQLKEEVKPSAFL